MANLNTRARHERAPLQLLPFRAVWRLVSGILALTGRLVAVILGLVFMIVSVVLTVTVMGAIVGIPLLILGLLLTLGGVPICTSQ